MVVEEAILQPSLSTQQTLSRIATDESGCVCVCVNLSVSEVKASKLLLGLQYQKDPKLLLSPKSLHFIKNNLIFPLPSHNEYVIIYRLQ